MRDFAFPEGNYPAREWPTGWIGIDSDEHITVEQGVSSDVDDVALRLKLPSKPQSDGKPIKFDVSGRSKNVPNATRSQHF